MAPSDDGATQPPAQQPAAQTDPADNKPTVWANKVLCFVSGHAWTTNIILLGQSFRECWRCGKREDLGMGPIGR